MYKNMLIDETIQIKTNILKYKLKTHITLKQLMISHSVLILKQNCSEFDSKIYKQDKDLVMGFPLSRMSQKNSFRKLIKNY